MNGIHKLGKALKHPELVVSRFNRLLTHSLVEQRYNPDGTHIFEEDWDNLIILDACRSDEFFSRSDLEGRYETRISRGSTSPEFIRGNFAGQARHDIVYLSANGWYGKIKDDIEAEVHRFEFAERDTANGLTTHPSTMGKLARQFDELYPNKRLIVHFMQPHQPYLGSLGTTLEYKRGLTPTIGANNLTHEEVLQGYRETLDIVLQEVETLLDDFCGKTVVTADHGELFGGRMRPIPVRMYGHPEGVYVDELVKVPWLVRENDERKEIVPEEPAQTQPDRENIEEHLEALGYKT